MLKTLFKEKRTRQREAWEWRRKLCKAKAEVRVKSFEDKKGATSQGK